MTQKGKDLLKSTIVLIAFMVLWAVLSYFGFFSEYVFPGPKRVWTALVSMIKSGELVRNMMTSLGRVFFGFGISFALSFILGVLACICPDANPYYRPFLEFVRHVPPMSLIPLLILWFGIGETSKIIVIVLTAFFPMFLNTESGLKGCDVKLLEVGEMLRMTTFQQFLKIRLPAAFPNILVGMQIGLGYSWRAIVGAEMIAAASGLGYLILDAQVLSRSDKVLVGIIMIGLLGLLMDVALNAVIKKISAGRGLYEQ